jgi:hypothetical protein
VLDENGAPQPLASACRAWGPDVTVLDVDDRSLDTPLGDWRDGVRVVGDNARVRAARAGTVTPPLAVENTGAGALVLDLGTPRGWVGVHVGRNDDGPAGTVTLTGLDAAGVPVATTGVGLPAGPAPAFLCVELTAGAPTMTRLEIAATTAAGQDVAEVVDAVALAAAPPPAVAPVAVTVAGPVGTLTLHPAAAVTVHGTVTTDDPVVFAAVWQSYTSPRDPGRVRVREVGPATVHTDATGRIRVAATGSLVAGDGRIGIHVRTAAGAHGDASRAVTVTRPDGVRGTVGEGGDAPGDGRADLRIAGIEITQGVSARALEDLTDEAGQRLAGVALLGGRDAVVRVLPTTEATTGSVTARLVGIRDGVTLAGSPLAPLGGPTTVAADAADLRVADDGVLTFRLPADWTATPGPLTLAVQLDPPGVDTRQNCGDCRAADLVHVDVEVSEPAPPLRLWLRPTADRSTLAGVVGSLGRWLPLGRGGIDLGAPPAAAAGDSSTAAMVVLDLLADLALGSVTTLAVTPPGDCDSRALIAGGWATAGACGALPAHALGHVLGLPHAPDGHAGGEGCGELDAVGLDLIGPRPRIVDPATRWSDGQMMLADADESCHHPHAHDLMSLGGRTVWPSSSTWRDVAAALAAGDPGPAVTVDEDDAVVRQAVVIAVDTGQVLAVQLPAGARLARPTAGLRGRLDGDDLPVMLMTDDADGQAVLAVTPADGWTDLAVTGEGIDVAVTRGQSPDRVQLTAPGGATSTGELRLSWGPAPDGATSIVEVSEDGGTTWLPLAATAETQLTIPDLPVDGDVLVRVQTGVDGAVAVSEPVGLRAPAVTPYLLVESPRDGAIFSEGIEVPLRVLVAGTVPDEELVWEVDGREVARGRDWAVAGLDVGEHEIAVRAVDRAAAGARMTVAVRVITDSDGDGMEDAWEVANGLDPLDPADGPRDGDGDGLSAREEFELGSDPGVVDSDGDGAWDGVEAAAGTDPLDASDTPERIHHWPDPLPEAVPASAGAVVSDAGNWWSGRLWLVLAVVAVVVLDVVLVVRNRRRRRYG